MKEQAQRHQSHLRGIARSAASLGMLNAASVGLTFLVGVLLARQLGPSGYGIYSLAMAVSALVGMFTEFGLPLLTMREFAAAEAKSSWGEAAGLVRWADRVIVAVSLILLGGFFAADMALDFAERSAFLATMAWAIVLVPVVGLAKLRGLALLSLGHTIGGQFAVLVLRPGLFALALAVVWLSRSDLGPVEAMTWQVASAGIALLAVGLAFRRFRPPMLRAATPVYRWRPWLAATMPMGMTEGLRLLQTQMATFMLSLLATTAAVGLFRVAAAAAAICLLPITILNVVASPYFARLHAEGDRDQLQKVVTSVGLGMFVCVAAIALPLALFARPLLTFAFGSQFGSSAPAFVILLLGNLGACALGPAVNLANMAGLERQVTMSTGVAVLIVTLTALALIPVLSATGGAIAVVAAIAGWNGILAAIVRRRIGINPTIFAVSGAEISTAARLLHRLITTRLREDANA